MNEPLRTRASFSDKIRQILARVTCRVAKTADEKEALYRLRYDANLREQAIEPNDSQRLADRFDETPNVINMGIFIEDTLISGLRMHVLSREQPFSPAFEVYNDLLAERVEAGATIIDGNRFVANYPLARSFPQLPYITLRLGLLAAEFYGGQYIIASVRSEHYPFYKREYFATKMCEPRPYPTLVKPLSLISIDYATDAAAIVERHDFYASTPEERAALFADALPI